MRNYLIALVMLVGCSGSGDDLRGVAMAGLGAPPPTVTVTARTDGLAVSWTAIASATSYSVYRSAAPVASVTAPTTSYVDSDLTAGSTYCYAVTGAFDDGSETPQSTAVCAVAGGGAVRPVRTKVIAPSNDGVRPYVVIDITQGVGHETLNLDGFLDVGDHIRAARVHVTDSPLHGPAVGGSGPTEMQTTLRAFSPSTGSTPIVLAQSQISDGSGREQTLLISGLDIAIVTGGSTHSLQVLQQFGNAPTVVWSIEVDYSHPQ